ncbi:MAG: DUF4070 domain-containing protein [bacterium]|jgi:radical SAM superfamily enzyme YgiQ (UPF0313 family)|nr:DUF4070 domain-containing protein [bacterium]
MRCLLINPEFPDTFWSFRHALTFTRRQAALPPLGLLTMAAILPGDWPKRMVDLNVRRLEEADLAWAEMVFIGGMSVQRASAEEAIRRCQVAGLPVVAGGPLFTVEPELFPQVDHLVLGEAELALPLFLADLAAGRPARLYHPEGHADLSRSPMPLWEMAGLQHYMTAALQYSRGCPFDCDFCNVTALLGRRPRQKSSEQVVRELNDLWDRGWRKGVFFVDDNFIGDRRRLATDLLPALIDWRKGRRGMPFNTQVSINLSDEAELMAMMVRAGFDTVFIGIETPEEASLAECRKRQNLGRDLVADTRRIQRAGLQVQGGFIVGFDHDTPRVFQRQIDLIQQSGIVTAMVGLLQAPPGTRLFQRLREAGRITAQEWGDNADGLTNIIPSMNLDSLREGYRALMGHLYSPSAYYARIRTFLREYRPAGVRAPLDRDRLAALLRSMWRLGVLGRERFQYWRLLQWTLLHRPRALQMAVTLAIYGHHFRKVCELHLRP